MTKKEKELIKSKLYELVWKDYHFTLGDQTGDLVKDINEIIDEVVTD